MDPYRLLKDELSYELAIRGISGEGLVPDLRKRFVKALQSKIPPIEKLFSALPAKGEFTLCVKKFEALKDQAEVLAEDDTNDIKRLHTRLLHVKFRLDRITELESEEAVEQEAMKKDVGNLLEYLTELQGEAEVPGKQMTPLLKLGTTSKPVVFTDVGAQSQPDQQQAMRQTMSIRDLKLYKWGLKYTADDPDQSLCSFLAEVEDRRTAKGIAKEELFRSAGELLGGTALVWYRSKRDAINTWDEFVARLRKTFLDPDYDHQLMEEIRKRTQGHQESIAIYIAKMQALFARLSKPLSDIEKFGIIKRNVKGEYRALLPLTSPTNIEELEMVLTNLEIGATMASRYEEPPVKGSLEPDLAYKRPPGKPVKVNPIVTSTTPSTPPAEQQRLGTNLRCWNCHQIGHTLRVCPKRNSSVAPSQDTTNSNASCPHCQQQGNSKGDRA